MGIEVPLDCSRSYTFVHGTQVMIMRSSLERNSHDVRIFDLGQRGRSSLPLQGEVCEIERRGSFEDGANPKFKMNRHINSWEPESWSDGSLIHLVSCFAHPARSEVVG